MIVHLAGVAFPPQADRDPAAAYDINALGVVRLLAVVARRRAAGVARSGRDRGWKRDCSTERTTPRRCRWSRSAAQRPVTIYAASKAAQEVIALRDYCASGARVICTRSFNHSGVGHAARVSAAVARPPREGEARRGESKGLTIGNDVVRDYLHVSDVAAAYLALAERGRPGEVYNVCSGTRRQRPTACRPMSCFARV